MEAQFKSQVELLLDILPLTLADERFAIKGGTAINLFVRDMPRLSVDIDLAYLPADTREQALKNIDSALLFMSSQVEKSFRNISSEIKRSSGMQAKQVVFVKANVRVKVEVNQVMRETVFPCIERDLCPSAQNMFERFVSARILSLEDLYAGKIIAGLDRQHPRDFFDIRLLLQNEGMTDKLRKVVLVYMISHNRPINELLAPNELDIKSLYDNELVGMSNLQISFKDILKTRRKLTQLLHQSLTKEEKEFLLSVKDGSPNWDLLGLKNIEKLPAVQWKLLNIRKMDQQKRQAAYERLKTVLFG